MSLSQNLATLALYPQGKPGFRLFALWYFAILMIAWNLAGHLFLGFEQSWAQPIVTVGAAILTQFFLEWVDAKANRRTPRFLGGLGDFMNMFPPPIIAGFACAMLLYPNERIWPMVFAAVLAISSKVLIRVKLSTGKKHHVFNPSNFGILATLLLFPASVGMAPPYQFTENLIGFWHWCLPALILGTGILIHGFATGRVPLCAAWILGFVGQGVFRALVFPGGNNWYVPLMPMSSAAFIVFTLYMIPDPATTPLNKKWQVLFGVTVAIVYGALQILHVVYGLFIALWLVCAVRGLSIAWATRSVQAAPARAPVPPIHQPKSAEQFVGAT